MACKLVLNSYLEIIGLDEGSVQSLGYDNRSEINGLRFTSLFSKFDRKGKLNFARWCYQSDVKFFEDRVILDTSKQDKQYKIFCSRSNGSRFSVLLAESDQVQTEINYKNASANWATIQKNFYGGILLLDEENNIRELSNKLIEIFPILNSHGVRYTREAILNKNFFDVFEFEIEDKIRDFIRKSAKNKDLSLEDTFEYNDSYIRLNISPIFELKTFKGSCIFFHDVTKELHQNQELRNQRQFMIESSRLVSLGEMAAGIAHEVNTPLGIILAYAEEVMAIEENMDAKEVARIRTLGEKMVKTVSRIGKIVSGMRKLSREASEDPMEKVCFYAILADSLDLSRAKIQKSGIKLQNVNEEKRLFVECRPVEISQVIMNLIHNAYDAIIELDQKEKWIHLEVLDLEEYVQFSITDSGPGIPAHIRAKILDPFFTTKELGKGTGLGLSVSSSIIKNHRGVLFVDERCPNTKFVFRIPKVERMEFLDAA